MNNKNKIYPLVGILLVSVFLNPADIYGMDDSQHPDESYGIRIFENIPISNVSGISDIRPETYLLFLWLYGMAFKCILVATGLIAFSFIFIVKGFVQLFRRGEL